MRSAWKGIFVTPEVLKGYKNSQLKNVFSRDCTVAEELVGSKISVHNGLTFYPIQITSEMVGFKFGEFVFTKKTGTLIHKNQLKKQKK